MFTFNLDVFQLTEAGQVGVRGHRVPRAEVRLLRPKPETAARRRRRSEEQIVQEIRVPVNRVKSMSAQVTF